MYLGEASLGMNPRRQGAMVAAPTRISTYELNDAIATLDRIHGDCVDTAASVNHIAATCAWSLSSSPLDPRLHPRTTFASLRSVQWHCLARLPLKLRL
jgi:hypothetical protein